MLPSAGRRFADLRLDELLLRRLASSVARHYRVRLCAVAKDAVATSFTLVGRESLVIIAVAEDADGLHQIVCRYRRADDGEIWIREFSIDGWMDFEAKRTSQWDLLQWLEQFHPHANPLRPK